SSGIHSHHGSRSPYQDPGIKARNVIYKSKNKILLQIAQCKYISQ
ncbi:mCG145834, partial [Mus musculus]